MNVFTTNEHPGNTRGKQTRGVFGALCVFRDVKRSFHVSVTEQQSLCGRSGKHHAPNSPGLFYKLLTGKSGSVLISRRVLLLSDGSLCRRSGVEEGVKE